jgi:hypothetical protein
MITTNDSISHGNEIAVLRNRLGFDEFDLSFPLSIKNQNLAIN